MVSVAAHGTGPLKALYNLEDAPLELLLLLETLNVPYLKHYDFGFGPSPTKESRGSVRVRGSARDPVFQCVCVCVSECEQGRVCV